jgi:hypothetical protein
VFANPPVNEGLNKMWAFAHRCGSPNGELQQLRLVVMIRRECLKNNQQNRCYMDAG